METINRKEMGELLKKRRKELGLKQINLVDHVLSPTTISNIENGKKKVSLQTIAYYCGKLGWEFDKLPEYKAREEADQTADRAKLKLLLKAIENELDFIKPDRQIYRKIRKLRIGSDHPCSCVAEFLLGKFFFKSDKLDKAMEHFNQAIEAVGHFPEMRQTNVMAASYYELGRIHHLRNDLEKALVYVEKGLESFVDGGERKHYKYHLLISKAIYLEKLERIDEALDILDEQMWPRLNEISTETQLNMYALQAILYNKKAKYQDAATYASKGIDIARLEKNYDRCFDLWTTLGVSYKHLGDLESAEVCFKSALRFEHKLRKKYLLPAYNYTELGLLYLQKGQLDEAQRILEEALRISNRSRDGQRRFEAYNALGECYLAQNKTIEALVNFEEARRIAEEHSFIRREQKVVLKLAQMYKEIDPAKHQKFFARFVEVSVKLLHGGEQPMHARLQHQMPDPPDG